jgi:hypothetical protein
VLFILIAFVLALYCVYWGISGTNEIIKTFNKGIKKNGNNKQKENN